MKIKFLSSGRWAGKPWEPQIQVIAGEVREIAEDLAKIILSSGKGVRYEEKNESETAAGSENLSTDIKQTTSGSELENQIDDLQKIGLSNSLITTLAGNGVTSLTELIEKTEDDINQMIGIGKARAKELLNALKKAGFSLKEGD